jgi:hypothetical protein
VSRREDTLPQIRKRKAGELLWREIQRATAEERGGKCLERALDSPWGNLRVYLT